MATARLLSRNLLFIIILLFSTRTGTAAQETIQEILWNVPDGKLADLSQTFTSGQTLPLSWNAYSSTEYVDTTKNLVDLWIAAFDFNLNPFSYRVLSNINLMSSGNFAWTISIPDRNLTISAKYVLRFKISSSIFNETSGDLSSPGFLVLQAATIPVFSSSSTTSSSVVQTSTVVSSSSSTAVSTTSTLPTITSTSIITNASSTPSAISTGLSGGAKGGIGVGAVILVLFLGGLIYFCTFRRKRRDTAELQVESEEDNKYERAVMPAEMATDMPAKMAATELPVNRY